MFDFMKVVRLLLAIFALQALTLLHSNADEVPFTYAPHAAYKQITKTASFTNGRYYLVASQNGVEKVRYVLDTNDSDVKNGRLIVKEEISGIQPITKAGVFTTTTVGEGESNQFRSKTTTLTHSLSNGVVILNYTISLAGKTFTFYYKLSLSGIALILEVGQTSPASYDPNHFLSRFDLGCIQMPAEAINSWRITPLSHLEGTPIQSVKINNTRYFISGHPDIGLSHSNSVPYAVPPNDYSCYYSTNAKRHHFAYTRYSRSDSISAVTPVLKEFVYYAVSSDIRDHFPKIADGPTQHKAALDNKSVLDIWNLYYYSWLPGYTLFNKVPTMLEILHTLGVGAVTAIVHDWQKNGFDCSLPNHFPGNSNLGGALGLRQMLSTISGFGDIGSLHLNFADGYRNSSYNLSNSYTKDPNQANVVSWVNQGCTGFTQAETLSIPTRYGFAAAEKAVADANGITNLGGIYYDVELTSGVHIRNDFNPNQTATISYKDTYRGLKTFFQQLSTLYGNVPLFGEGHPNRHYNPHLFLGTRNLPTLTEGATQIAGGQDKGDKGVIAPDFVHYELSRVATLQGIGYTGRFNLQDSSDPAHATYPSSCFIYGSNYCNSPRPEEDRINGNIDLSRQRAFIIANKAIHFLTTDGFAGLPNSDRRIVLSDYMRMWLRLYFSLEALKSQYISSQTTSILYFNSSGPGMTLGAAIDANYNFSKSRLLLTFANGLAIYLNFSDATWTVTPAGHGTQYLPPNGWFGYNNTPGLIMVAFNALVNTNGTPSPTGYEAIYSNNGEYTSLEVRHIPNLITSPTITIGGISTDKFRVQKGSLDYGDFEIAEMIGDINPPRAPTNLTATYNSLLNTIELAWDDNSNNESGFKVSVSTNNGPYVDYSYPWYNQESYTFVNPQPNTNYSFQVTSRRNTALGFRDSAPSTTNITIGSSPTASPTVSPTVSPTASPTASPTISPTASPTVSPTISPTASPTASPTTSPTVLPTSTPTPEPTVDLPPTPVPTFSPAPSLIPQPTSINIIFNPRIQVRTTRAGRRERLNFTSMLRHLSGPISMNSCSYKVVAVTQSGRVAISNPRSLNFIRTTTLSTPYMAANKGGKRTEVTLHASVICPEIIAESSKTKLRVPTKNVAKLFVQLGKL